MVFDNVVVKASVRHALRHLWAGYDFKTSPRNRKCRVASPSAIELIDRVETSNGGERFGREPRTHVIENPVSLVFSRSPITRSSWKYHTAIRWIVTRSNGRSSRHCHVQVESCSNRESPCFRASVACAYVSQLSPPMWLGNYIERQPYDPPPVCVARAPSDVIAILIADSRDSVRPINVACTYGDRSVSYRFHGIGERTT